MLLGPVPESQCLVHFYHNMVAYRGSMATLWLFHSGALSHSETDHHPPFSCSDWQKMLFADFKLQARWVDDFSHRCRTPAMCQAPCQEFTQTLSHFLTHQGRDDETFRTGISLGPKEIICIIVHYM